MGIRRPGLAVLLGLFATISIGVGEARSQLALLRVCNQSHDTAQVAITAHPAPGDSRFLIKGWWIVHPGTCVNAQTAPLRQWAYFYAEAYSGADVEWRGRDQRFCVSYPGPFERFISSSYSCSGNVLKSFTGYFIDEEMFTWYLD